MITLEAHTWTTQISSFSSWSAHLLVSCHLRLHFVYNVSHWAASSPSHTPSSHSYSLIWPRQIELPVMPFIDCMQSFYIYSAQSNTHTHSHWLRRIQLQLDMASIARTPIAGMYTFSFSSAGVEFFRGFVWLDIIIGTAVFMTVQPICERLQFLRTRINVIFHIGCGTWTRTP